MNPTFGAENDSGVGMEEELQAPVQRAGLAAVPNPFVTRTTLCYTLPCAGRVTLHVFDAAGRLVVTPVDKVQGSGTHDAAFAAAEQAHGIYFARLTACGHDGSSFTESIKLAGVR
jgi:hypothetical protein